MLDFTNKRSGKPLAVVAGTRNTYLRGCAGYEEIVMNRQAGVVAALAAAAVIAHGGAIGGAATSISGSVTIARATSNANALVYIVDASGPFPPTAAEMDQRGLAFVPHLLPVVAGSGVTFLNSDGTTHNVFSPDYEKYDLGTWSKGESKEYVFPACAKPPCVYAQLCKIHPEMDAYIAVLQNPYFAVTGKDGHYEIHDVPPGTYMVGAWYATRTRRYQAPPQSVTVDAGAPIILNFEINR